MIENIVLTKQINNITTKRDIKDQSVLEFHLLVSHENLEEIFMEDDAKTSFNKFLNVLYIYIPTNCTQLIYFINNTLKHMYCLKL